MALQTAADIPLQITSDNSSSERRVSPAWTIAQFKTRLEPITGIPATSQKLHLKLSDSQAPAAIEAADEDTAQLGAWPLQAYAEIHVTDLRPPSQRPSYTDPSAVPKYTMPAATYEALPATVLSFKKTHGLGRFDPDAPSLEAQKAAVSFREASERHIVLGARCRLLNTVHEDGRRGTVAYVGAVEQIPGVGAWVGVALDEPTGKNDGSVGGHKYFDCGRNFGVFVRPERVEVGDFPVLDELGEEMEEM